LLVGVEALVHKAQTMAVVEVEQVDCSQLLAMLLSQGLLILLQLVVEVLLEALH
jgi:hypothetical protein